MKQPVPASGPPLQMVSTSPADTLAVGRRLAGILMPGDVVLLVGRLGAGKTLVAAGIGQGLGVDQPVTSPTFVLMRSYDGFLPLHHVDVYRLGSTAEFDDLDLFGRSDEGVVLIEWGNAVSGEVPSDHLVVELEITGHDRRDIRLTPYGSWCARPLEEIAA